MLGALAAELIRIGAAFREGKPPKFREYVASVIYILLGAGAALFGWDNEQSAFKVAVLGAAFPLLFSAAINTATSSESRRSGKAQRRRSLGDYLAGRF
jgi:hypothetical protein